MHRYHSNSPQSMQVKSRLQVKVEITDVEVSAFSEYNQCRLNGQSLKVAGRRNGRSFKSLHLFFTLGRLRVYLSNFYSHRQSDP